MHHFLAPTWQERAVRHGQRAQRVCILLQAAGRRPTVDRYEVWPSLACRDTDTRNPRRRAAAPAPLRPPRRFFRAKPSGTRCHPRRAWSGAAPACQAPHAAHRAPGSGNGQHTVSGCRQTRTRARRFSTRWRFPPQSTSIFLEYRIHAHPRSATPFRERKAHTIPPSPAPPRPPTKQRGLLQRAKGPRLCAPRAARHVAPRPTRTCGKLRAARRPVRPRRPRRRRQPAARPARARRRFVLEGFQARFSSSRCQQAALKCS